MPENIENNETSNAPAEKGSIVNDIFEIIESTLITIYVIVMIFTYLFHPVNVVGSSMNDTLVDGDKIGMCMVNPSISYGDIVIIDNDESFLLDENGNVYGKDISDSRLKECLIKRVIGEPGQTIDVNTETHEITVDGKVLDEPYIKELTATDYGSFNYPITIPEGYYFVMGDNRNNSSDSRDSDVGLISRKQIYGKAVARYIPFKNFKILL